MSKGLHKELPEAHLIRVPTGPGKSGKSWTFILTFSSTGKSWEKTTGPGKSLQYA